MMEPTPEAIELFLSESDISAPPTMGALCSRLEVQLQSLRHGLSVVQQKLGDLAELPGHWIEEAQNVARDQGIR